MLTRNVKAIVMILIAASIIIAPLVLVAVLNQPAPTPPGDEGEDEPELDPLETPVSSINITLLDTAGVMIEANNIRIYIDPYRIPGENFTQYPADLVLITHGHIDHYSKYDIRDVETEDTLVVMPQSMSYNFHLHNNCLGVKPGDNFQYRGINITAFDLYLDDYPSGQPSAHPKYSNWTSYIIEIDGFKIFHAGDAKYMPEYENFTWNIDVAFLPIYYDAGLGVKDVSLAPIIQVIEKITPEYCIPTHWYGSDNELFMQDYVPSLDDDCIIMNLEFFESHVFSNEHQILS